MSAIREIALAKAIGGSGGGSSVTVEELTVNQNGTTTAPEGTAYNPVVADVPNSYTAGDEGRVVSDGALVAQTSLSVAENDTYDTTLINSMIVDVPTGGGVVVPKDVNFYDYDGTLVASYTAAEFSDLEALPANPDHTDEGLTAQGWNYNLSTAKSYVAYMGKLEVGQSYITTDGKTRIHIHLEQGRTSPMLGICVNGTVDVDWGDGTAHATLTGTSLSTPVWTNNHDFPATGGDFRIDLTPSEGSSFAFYGDWNSGLYAGLLVYTSAHDTRNYPYRSAIRKIEIGNGVSSIGYCSFTYCYNLSSVTIPASITGINQDAFNGCHNLTGITIPLYCQSIGNNAFYECSSLRSVAIPYGPLSTIGGSAFYGCRSLARITIPSSLGTIGDSAFAGCVSLVSVAIMPGLYSLGEYAFSACQSLTSITLPPSCNTIKKGAFSRCYSLAKLIMSSGVQTIKSKAFEYCRALSNVTIPVSMSSIEESAFLSWAVGEIHFKPYTPPTVAAGVFSSIPTDCKIYVPTGRLSAYTSASNYPSSSTYQYIEE